MGAVVGNSLSVIQINPIQMAAPVGADDLAGFRFSGRWPGLLELMGRWPENAKKDHLRCRRRSVAVWGTAEMDSPDDFQYTDSTLVKFVKGCLQHLWLKVAAVLSFPTFQGLLATRQRTFAGSVRLGSPKSINFIP